jgi:hypothetical protein
MKGTKMFNRHSLKLGLTGALLIIIMGSFTACSDEGPTAPVATPQLNSGCIVVGGMLVCQ